MAKVNATSSIKEIISTIENNLTLLKGDVTADDKAKEDRDRAAGMIGGFLEALDKDYAYTNLKKAVETRSGFLMEGDLLALQMNFESIASEMSFFDPELLYASISQKGKERCTDIIAALDFLKDRVNYYCSEKNKATGNEYDIIAFDKKITDATIQAEQENKEKEPAGFAPIDQNVQEDKPNEADMENLNISNIVEANNREAELKEQQHLEEQAAIASEKNAVKEIADELKRLSNAMEASNKWYKFTKQSDEFRDFRICVGALAKKLKKDGLTEKNLKQVSAIAISVEITRAKYGTRCTDHPKTNNIRKARVACADSVMEQINKLKNLKGEATSTVQEQSEQLLMKHLAEKLTNQVIEHYKPKMHLEYLDPIFEDSKPKAENVNPTIGN